VSWRTTFDNGNGAISRRLQIGTRVVNYEKRFSPAQLVDAAERSAEQLKAALNSRCRPVSSGATSG